MLASTTVTFVALPRAARPRSRPSAKDRALCDSLQRRVQSASGACMDGVTIYHNPACGKSRGALEILRQRGLSLDIIEYLKTPADRAALGRILDRLPGEAADLVRKDKRFQELGLNAANYQTRAQVIDLLVAHPELMERPVVLHGGRAVIARPAERVNEILD